MTKLDFSKPDQLQTRDGRAVRIYATDGACTYCIHGATLTKHGWEANRWDNNGRYVNDKTDNPSDLVRKPTRMTGWFNVSGDGVWYIKHSTLEAARDYVAKGTQSCVGQIYIDSEVQE